jgi:hypothetical protein
MRNLVVLFIHFVATLARSKKASPIEPMFEC